MLLLIEVLPPISTEGMTADDVTSLTESTHDAMQETLKEISRPDPRHFAPQHPTVESSPSQPEQVASRAGEEDIELRERKIHSGMSEGGRSRNSEESTEDEMDEDAVLLKRPTEEL